MAVPHIYVKCANCLCMSSAFKKLTPDQLAQVDESRSELYYRKGETLCKEGAFISNIIFIKKGKVKSFLDRGDQPTIISLEKSGAFLGLSSTYGEDVFQYSVEALEDTEVCLTDIRVFRKILQENAAFANEIIKLLNDELVKSYDRLFSLTNKQISARFAELILFLMDHFYQKNPFELTLSRNEIAQIIATTHENVSRLIQDFNREKVIQMKMKNCHVLNIDRLMEIGKK